MTKTRMLGAGLFITASYLYGQEPAMPSAPPPARSATLTLKMLAESEVSAGKPVVSAPYSADEVTTTTQMLADGNRIVHTSTAHVDRDDQGRIRVEHTLGNIGGVETSGAHHAVMINDPVAHVHYFLQPDSRTATKASLSGSLGIPGKDGEKDKPMAEKRAAERMQSVDIPTVITTFDDENGPLSGPMPTVIYHSVYEASRGPKPETEDLGTETMDGLTVKRTRTTLTLPPGAEGNEQPLRIVDERWYSPDLHLALKTVHSDPRMGETVFAVTNLSRANPDLSLFQVPADYQLIEGPGVKNVVVFGGAAPPSK